MFMLTAVRCWLLSIVLLGCGLGTKHNFVRARSSTLTLEGRLDKLCREGDLYGLFKYFSHAKEKDASILFGLSALNLILHSNVSEAVRLHLAAKALSPTTIPPLANIYLQGKSCGGMSDLFYVGAVIVKQMVDSNIEERAWKEALTTLITLTSDTGLSEAAEAHLQHALRLSPDDTALRIRATLMTPALFDNTEALHLCRERLEERAAYLRDHLSTMPALSSLDEFVLSPTFYYIYQGYNDRSILSTLHETYISKFPALGHGAGHVSPSITSESRKLRVGFVSAYFRRHSVCKLFCEVISSLATRHSSTFDVFIFSALAKEKEDSVTAALKANPNLHFESLGRLLLSNRETVTSKNIDILIYLDIGMDPAGIVWAAARLAPIQMCLWGHPTTTALPHMDYYLSSDRFHRYPTNTSLYAPTFQNVTHSEEPFQSRFSEQLVRFGGLGTAFVRPQLERLHAATGAENYFDALVHNQVPATLAHLLSEDADTASSKDPSKQSASATLNRLVRMRQQHGGRRVILCPQFAPKLHPLFDEVLTTLLVSGHRTNGTHLLSTAFAENSASAPILVLMSTKEKRLQWQRLLETRLQRSLRSLLQSSLWTQEQQRQLNNDQDDSVVAPDEVEFKLSIEKMLQKAVKIIMQAQIVWVEGLDPQQYLQLLYLGDVMLDPFPFGGGVTVLEALAVCTPVVTLPAFQTVPQLAAGMLDHVWDSMYKNEENAQTSLFAALDVSDYITRVQDLLTMSASETLEERRRWCEAVDVLYHPTVENSDQSLSDPSAEYASFFRRVASSL